MSQVFAPYPTPGIPVCTAGSPFTASGVNSARGRHYCRRKVGHFMKGEAAPVNGAELWLERINRSPPGKCVPPRDCLGHQSKWGCQDGNANHNWGFGGVGVCRRRGRLRSFLRGGLITMFVTKGRRRANPDPTTLQPL